MQGVVTYQRRDGRWVSGRATFSIREFDSNQRGVADTSVEAHCRFLENDAEAKARENNVPPMPSSAHLAGVTREEWAERNDKEA